MKKLLISAVVMLALAGTSAFAQTKTAGTKKSTNKPAVTETTKKPKKHRRKKKSKSTASANSGATMKPKAKKGNKNKM